ncbi:MAG: TolC family protein [Myxococcales bacterium]|nr:TolC family protein [Myxococcales bacterium]
MHRILAILALAWPGAALAGGPLPDEAAHLVPEDWSHSTQSLAGPWWTQLGGEELQHLLDVALTDNVDAQSGALRVDQTRARTQQTAAALLPSLSVSATGSLNPNVNALVFDPDPNAAFRDTYTRGEASVDLTVPLSVWKGLPSARAAQADTAGARAGASDTQATVAVQTGRLWLDLAYAHERQRVVQQQVDVDTELATLVEARYRAGATSGTDVLQQRQQLASSQSNLPDASAALVRAERALNVHLRRPVDAELPVDATALPDVPLQIALPEPRTLVAADPGVRTALAELQAATRRTAAARADFLPDLTASASAGTTFNGLQSEPLAETWSVGAQLSVPLFNGGRSRGALQEARATQSTEVVQLQDTVLQLVLAVDNALTTFEQRTAEVAADAAALQAAQAALTAARADYQAGQTSYNTVLNSLNSQKQAELALLVTRRTQLDAYLDVAAAAAGAWVQALEA